MDHAANLRAFAKRLERVLPAPIALEIIGLYAAATEIERLQTREKVWQESTDLLMEYQEKARLYDASCASPMTNTALKSHESA